MKPPVKLDTEQMTKRLDGFCRLVDAAAAKHGVGAAAMVVFVGDQVRGISFGRDPEHATQAAAVRDSMLQIARHVARKGAGHG